MNEKKRFYNRVRRTCKLHDLELVYDGVPKNYRAVEIHKDGVCLFADRSENWKPLDINWQRLHEEMTQYGYKGGIK